MRCRRRVRACRAWCVASRPATTPDRDSYKHTSRTKSDNAHRMSTMLSPIPLHVQLEMSKCPRLALEAHASWPRTSTQLRYRR
eukprot:15707-Prymnesium_polylepis.2